MYWVRKFHQEAWLNLTLQAKKNTKHDCEKDFFKLMNNAVSRKTMENIRNHRDNKLLTAEAKSYCLVSKPNYYTTVIHKLSNTFFR